MKVPTPINPRTNAPSGGIGYNQGRQVDISSGARALASVVKDYSDSLAEEERKKELFKVSQIVVNETNDLQKNFNDKTQVEPLGAPNFVQRVNGEYQTRHDKIIQDMRNQGYSDDAINEAALRLGGLRSQFVARAIDFQDKSNFAKVGADTDNLATNLSAIAQDNPASVSSTLNELRMALQHSGLDQVEQEQVYQQHKDVILQGARQGFALQNPETVVRLFDPKSLQASVGGPIDVGQSQPFDLDSYVQKLIPAEGTGKNTKSSAKGYGQFLESTWKEYYQKAFGNTGESDAQILAKRSDPEIAKQVLGKFTGDNIAQLSAAGLPISDTTVYLSHFLGINDAIKVLKAHADATISELVRPASIKSNAPVFNKVKTVGDLLAWASKKMGVEQQQGAFVQAFLPQPIPGRSYNVEDAIQELGMTVDQAKEFVATGKDTRTATAQPTSTQPTEQAVQAVLPIGPDGKTGIPIIDMSSGPERMQMLAWAKTAMADDNANFKAQVEVNHQNAVNAYLSTGAYTGTKPTLEDYNKAYGPILGPQKYAELTNAAEVGPHIQQFKTLPVDQIEAQVEALKPKDTSSPTYTEELQAYTKARQAADSIESARRSNTVGYMFSTFPKVATQLQNAKTSQDRRAAYQAVNNAYQTLGVPQSERYLFTKQQAQELWNQYDAMSPGQKIAQLEQWQSELGPLHSAFMRQMVDNGKGVGPDAMLWFTLRGHPNDQAIMSQVLAGEQILKEDPSRRPSSQIIATNFKDKIGSALQSLNPAAANIYNDAATAIYVANGGRTDAQSFDADLYAESLRKAVGGIPNNDDSGIVDMSKGRVKDVTILPQGETRVSFQNWIDQLKPGQLTALSAEKLPGVYASGRQVPIQDVIDHGVFVAVAPNKYIIKMDGDGLPIKTPTGNNFVVQIYPRTR